MRRCLSLLILPFFVLSASAIEEANPVDSPELSDVAPHAQPMVYGESYLNDDWTLFHVFEDNFQVVVGWEQGFSVITVTRMEFADNRSREGYIRDMDQHYEVILANYMPYDLHTSCVNARGVILDEFEANLGAIEYELRHYLWREDETVFWILGLLFPSDQLNDLDAMAATFHPNFVSCNHEDNI